MSYYSDYCNVDVLKGKTLVSLTDEGDELVFKTTDGENIVQYTAMDEQARLAWVRQYLETA